MGGIFTSLLIGGYNKLYHRSLCNNTSGDIPENEVVKTRIFTNINHRKRGLLIGVNYNTNSTKYDNRDSSGNIIQNIRSFLKEKCFFSRWQLKSLEDSDATRKNIVTELLQLVAYSNAQPGSELWFSYTGIGIPNISVANKDRSDVIYPYDYERNGVIDDEWIHKNFLRALNPDTKLFILVDCGKSGSIMTLPYYFKSTSIGKVMHYGFKRCECEDPGYDGDADSETDIVPVSGRVCEFDEYTHKTEHLCSIIKLGVCDDNQIIGDYFDFSFNEYQGALSSLFLRLDNQMKLCNNLDNMANNLISKNFTHRPVLSYSHIWGDEISII